MANIALLITQRADLQLLLAHLHELGHTPVEDCIADFRPTDWRNIHLAILDEVAARRYHRALMDLKRQLEPQPLPLLTLLPQDADETGWLETGFDDVLRVPLTRAELASRLQVTLRWRAKLGARYAAVFHNAPIGLYCEGPDGRLLMANAAFTHLLGYTSFEACALQTLDSLGVVCDPPRAAFYAELAQSGRVVGRETSWRRPDGSVRFVRENMQAIRDEAGVRYYAGTIEDITERKTREHASGRERDLLSRLVQNSPVGLAVVNRSGAITFANRQAETLLGLTRDQITQRAYNAPEWVITDAAGQPFPEADLPFSRVMATGQPVYDVQHAIHWPNGRRRLLSINAMPLIDNAGQLEGVVASFEDISDRQRVEEALSQSEVRFRVAAECATDLIYEWHIPSGQLQWFGPIDQRLGYAAGEFPRTLDAWAQAIAAEDRHRVVADVEQCLMNGRRYEGEYIILAKDGTARYWIDRGQPLVDAQGQVETWVGAVTDVTERRRAEAALAASERRFRALIEYSADAISLVLADGTVVYDSPRAATMSGFALDELLGKNVLNRIHPEDAAASQALLQQLLEKPATPIRSQLRLLHKDGTWRWTEVIATNLLAEPSVQAIVANYRDITERKRTQEVRQVLLEIMQGVAITTDLQAFLALVHNSVAQLIYAENFFVALYQPDTGLFEEVYSVDQYDPPAAPSRLEKSISAYVFRTGQPLRLTQARFDELAAQGEVQLIGTNSPSWLGVPLKTSKGAIGVMVVQDYEQNDRYSEHDVEVLASVAGQVALAVERMQAEAALRESEERFRSIVNHEPECVKIVSSDGRVLEMNPAGLGMIGARSLDQVVNRSVYDLIHPADRATYRQLHEAVCRGASGQQQFRIMGMRGNLRWMESHATPLRDRHGQIISVLSVTRDITDRKHAETQIQQQVRRLAALRAIDRAISSNLDLRRTLSVFLEQVITQLGVDAANVLLVNGSDQTLVYAAGQGFRSHHFQDTPLRLGEGRAGQAALQRRIIIETGSGMVQPQSLRTGLLERDKFVSYYGVPLIARSRVVGVLEIFHRAPLEADPEWLEFLEALAGQAAIAIENATLLDGLQQSNQELVLAYDATIAGWSRALDLRDKETEGHSQRVTELTLRLARALSLPEAELVHIRRGALLHDIGKMGIPDHILLKPGPLTDEEWTIMRRHPAFAYDLLSPISFLRPALDIPYCHHEKWDGSGYPRGLKAEQIPLPARLFAVVDVWDALTSHRPYRPAWSAAKARAHLQAQAGKHFDPRVVEAFLQIVG